jgi:hypothetical protein
VPTETGSTADRDGFERALPRARPDRGSAQAVETRAPGPPCLAARGGPRRQSFLKLYPWEWMFREQFGAFLPGASTRWIEPPWKAILSSKGVLPLPWSIFPRHPNLLPAYFADDPGRATLGDSYVTKPLAVIYLPVRPRLYVWNARLAKSSMFPFYLRRWPSETRSVGDLTLFTGPTGSMRETSYR